MALQDLEMLLSREDLLCQKDTVGVHITTNEGETIEVFRDGCAAVSLFNGLRLNKSEKSFEGFAEDLVAGRCLERGGINWKTFNKLPYDVKFAWMQDAERPACDPVNLDRLRDWISSGAMALVKLQSIYGKDRRHFMVALRVNGDTITCLESSDPSGALRLRDIQGNEVLGIRYFITPNRSA